MTSKRVQALFTQIEQAWMELAAEFEYLETVNQDQGAEIKQLKFEAMGRTDLRQQHVVDWDQDHQMDLELDHSVEEDGLLAELILEGTINGKPLPGELIAAENAEMHREINLVDAPEGDYFDVMIWRWVAIVDVHYASA